MQIALGRSLSFPKATSLLRNKIFSRIIMLKALLEQHEQTPRKSCKMGLVKGVAKEPG